MSETSGRMEIVTGIDALAPEHGRLVFAVGVFDGLHRGHVALLERLRVAAEQRAARPGVITFDAHPDEVLLGAAPALLMDPQERLERLSDAGVAVTVVQHFDAELRATTYRDFVMRITSRVDLAGFVMTPDAAFGHRREGTPEALAALGREVGFEVEVAPVLADRDGPIRSSEIRAAIASGAFGRAAAMLGRDVTVVGRAEPGEAGAATGLQFDLPVVLPPDGMTRVLVEADGLPAPFRRRLVIAAGRARLEPAVDVAAGARLVVRLPIEDGTATIRRS